MALLSVSPFCDKVTTSSTNSELQIVPHCWPNFLPGDSWTSTWPWAGNISWPVRAGHRPTWSSRGWTRRSPETQLEPFINDVTHCFGTFNNPRSDIPSTHVSNTFVNQAGHIKPRQDALHCVLNRSLLSEILALYVNIAKALWCNQRAWNFDACWNGTHGNSAFNDITQC